MTRKLARLTQAIDRRNAKWLDDNYTDVADALRLEIENGATADDVGKAVRQLSGEQDWFARKVASAARHVENVVALRN